MRRGRVPVVCRQQSRLPPKIAAEGRSTSCRRIERDLHGGPRRYHHVAVARRRAAKALQGIGVHYNLRSGFEGEGAILCRCGKSPLAIKRMRKRRSMRLAFRSRLAALLLVRFF